MLIKKNIIDQICKHALDEYPYECCGIVTGTGSEQALHLCVNIQNQLHEEDPSRYPRDARIAYTIERSEFDRVINSAQGRGEEVLAFYHSHPEHEAYFSEEDHAAQTVFGEPEFPDALQIVVSVMNGNISDIKCYRWDSGAQIFLDVGERRHWLFIIRIRNMMRIFLKKIMSFTQRFLG